MAIEAAPGGAFRWQAGSRGEPVVEAFHAVRRLTYASTGSREPAELVRTGRGACTAKHLLLGQLLSSLGVPSRVELVFGRFGRGLPDDAPGMPDDLRAMIRAGGVPDYHNVVAARLDDGEVVLDATWNDALIAVGFPGNADWRGHGDTRMALEGERLSEQPDDLVGRKAELLAALPAADRERRQRFLELLSDYSVSRQA